MHVERPQRKAAFEDTGPRTDPTGTRPLAANPRRGSPKQAADVETPQLASFLRSEEPTSEDAGPGLTS